MSRTEGIDCYCNSTTNPAIQSARRTLQRTHLLRMLVVIVDSAIDHSITAGAEQSEDCTTGCQQDRGWKPGKSTGAPAFRYCLEMAVNDRDSLLRGRAIQCRLSEHSHTTTGTFLRDQTIPPYPTCGGSTNCAIARLRWNGPMLEKARKGC